MSRALASLRINNTYSNIIIMYLIIHVLLGLCQFILQFADDPLSTDSSLLHHSKVLSSISILHL